MSKLMVIVGITGNQGGSVARAFQRDPSWRIRGLTRDTTSPASQKLSAQGIEMKQADLHAPETLITAFQGANLIFSVTDCWKPFFDPANVALAESRGISIGQLCYDLEYEQGKNIVSAAAHPSVIPNLHTPGLIASTLSSARARSKGKYQRLYHYDAKADVFPTYLETHHPALAEKTSYLQTGYFMSSWTYMPRLWPGKQPPSSSAKKFLVRMATAPDAVQPHLDPAADVGAYVSALSQMPAGRTAMAAGEWCTWPEWIRKWARARGLDEERDVGYEEVSVDEMAEALGGAFGREVAEMYEYSTWPGYDGVVGEREGMLRAGDLREMGFDIPTTTVEEYTKKTDWSRALQL